MCRNARPGDGNVIRLLLIFEGRPMTHTSDQAAFRYSRIYAEGWKAARSLLNAGANLADIQAMNPYQSGLERTRWSEGFAKASE
jgi:hypothetical protein